MMPNMPCDSSMLLLIMLAFPFFGAFIVKILQPQNSVKAGFAVLLIQLALCIGAGREALNAGSASVGIQGVYFTFDQVSFIFGLTSVFIGIFIYLFSAGYFAAEKPEEQSRFSFWGLVFVGSMMGVVLSDNLVSLYFFWELAGLCSWRLIGFYRKDEHLLKADKAFLITAAGAGLMFMGFSYIYLLTGSLSIGAISGMYVPSFVFALIFLGVITKSATFPFHTWLPDASVAPTPVTAFLHAAVLVKIGIYGLIRIFGLTLSISGGVLWAGWIALLSSFVAGIIAMRENDIKKILAYSTVSQLGFMLAALMMFNYVALRGILIFYVAHALGKGCLFLCAGMTEKTFGTKDIRAMGGLMKKMPALTYAFLFSMLSVIGVPPLPGFFGKLEAITGMLAEGRVLFGLLAILTSALTLLYLFRVFRQVFMGDPREMKGDQRGFKPMTASVVILASASLLLGILFVL